MQLSWNERNLGTINACFDEGALSIIVGDNGVGKTTLLYHLALLKITNGEYIYQDTSLDLSHRNMTDQFRYQHIFILLQELSLFDKMTLRDYLDLMKSHPDILYDLPFPLDRKLGDFSLGEKQYLLLYGGFLQDKSIYLLDEPTSALDQDMKYKVYDMINQLKQRGKIIIVVSHDQDFISLGDCLYEFKDQRLILQKKKNIKKTHVLTSYQGIHAHKLIKIRLSSPIFRYNLIMILICAMFCLCLGTFINTQKRHFHQQLLNGTRQNIIITSLEKPSLSKEYAQIEPYYIYEYQNYVFINQALPLTLNHSKYLNINDKRMIYYQEDSINYIQQVDDSFNQKQIGYLITFQDPSLYAIIMKQLTNQYVLNDIHSLYLEKQYCQTLENEYQTMMLFYQSSLFIIILLLSIFYAKKTKQDNMNDLLLFHLLGLSHFKIIIYFMIEMILQMTITYLILWHDHLEWFILNIFIISIYIVLFPEIHRDFSHLYR